MPIKKTMVRMNVRLPPDLDARLAREAAAGKRPKAAICRTALIEAAIELHIQSMVKDGERIPEPSSRPAHVEVRAG